MPSCGWIGWVAMVALSMDRKKSGAIYIMLAAVLWSFGGLGAKFIPWNPLSIACVRGAVAAITIACIRRSWRVTLNRATLLAALCMTATTVLFMTSNKLTTAANAIVFQYTAPVYVIVASILLLKVRPRPVEIITVLVTFGGISLFFIDHLGHGRIVGDLVALLSGVSFAGVFFFNSLPEANPQEASYLGCLLSALLAPVLFFDPQVTAGGVLPWAVVILLGILQLGVAYFLFAKGVQDTGAVTSSIICSAEPILNPIWVFLVVGEMPGVLSIIGAAIVVATICFYNIMTAKRQESR